MSNIYKFNKEEQEHSCPTCDLVEEYFSYAIEADSKSELYNIIEAVVQEAKELGMKDVLSQRITSDFHLLKHLEGEHCDICCEDEDCDC